MTRFAYPVSLDVEGRVCRVVGGGALAEEKARGLIEAGARVEVVAPTFIPALDQLEARGELKLVRHEPTTEDLEGAFLVFAAPGDPDLNARLFEAAERRGVLFNAVDDIDHCHFAAPSLVRRGDVAVAISTGGRAPALSKRLRLRLERQLEPELGQLAALLGEAREEALWVRRTVDFQTWAARWQKVLDRDLISLIRHGRVDEARRWMLDVLEGRTSTNVGRVSIVGAGPGDPGLITVRGRELLERADVVVHDRLVHPSLLEGKDAIDVGKRAGRHPFAQGDINTLLVDLARSGRSVVRLKGGDPLLFGRGSEEAEALAAEGIPFEIVPAPPSATAALAYAGIPLTDRRVASSVAIISGHDLSRVDWDALVRSTDTIVVLMGRSRLREIATELLDHGLDGSTPTAMIEAGTLPEQRVAVVPLGDMAKVEPRAGDGPATIVIGRVVELRDRIRWFDERDQDRTPHLREVDLSPLAAGSEAL